MMWDGNRRGLYIGKSCLNIRRLNPNKIDVFTPFDGKYGLERQDTFYDESQRENALKCEILIF